MSIKGKPEEIDFDPIPEKTEMVGKCILNSAFKVHSALGPGLLESTYEACLAYEILENQLQVQTQVALPISYQKITIELGYRIDMLVENCVIVELKAVERLIPLYEAQLLTYMKLSNIRLGYILNFNTTRLKNGIRRMVR